jgi:hypothetical protein
MAPMTFQRPDFRNAIIALLALLGALTALMSALNLAVVNNVLFPVTQYLPMFEILWRDNPSAALGILADKSVLAIGHFDFDSGLYLWTLEFDILTLLVFSAATLTAAYEWRRRRLTRKWVWLALALVIFSRAYGQVLAHCAGPTWLGFVSLYALGVDKFPVNAVWQWLFVSGGAALLAWQFTRAEPPAAKT